MLPPSPGYGRTSRAEVVLDVTNIRPTVPVQSSPVGVSQSKGWALDHSVVLRVRANPEPHDQPDLASAQGPIALIDSDRPDIIL